MMALTEEKFRVTSVLFRILFCPLSEIKTYTILASELLLANYSAESSWALTSKAGMFSFWYERYDTWSCHQYCFDYYHCLLIYFIIFLSHVVYLTK